MNKWEKKKTMKKKNMCLVVSVRRACGSSHVTFRLTIIHPDLLATSVGTFKHLH